MSKFTGYVTFVDIRIQCQHDDGTTTNLWSGAEEEVQTVICPTCGEVYTIKELNIRSTNERPLEGP